MLKEKIKNFLISIERKNSLALSKNEDQPVLEFLSSLSNKNLNYLEAGSGAGRFLKVVHNFEKSIKIVGVEINLDLVELTKKDGFDVVVGNLLKLPFENENFDLVHCSHVIEHFKFPEVTEALDEMLRVLRVGGYLIIRSPLMNNEFFLNIDHVRPYPPESIINYYNNKQQQKVGKYKIKEVDVWYRRESVKLNFSNSRVIIFINIFLGLCWRCFRFPRGKKNGYVLIIQKL